MKRKQITFIRTYESQPLKPKIGDIVYLIESQTIWTGNDAYGRRKAGDVSPSHFRLSYKPARTIPGGNECVNGWLGAYCGNNTQSDSWALGKWTVISVENKPVDNWSIEEKFVVKLRQ